MHFGFMDVILLHGGHQHVSVTLVVIFRVVRTSCDIVCTVNCSRSSMYIITAHQSGSQFTTRIFYIHHPTYCTKQHLNSDILQSSLFNLIIEP